jgi:ATP-binding protein involved in chromosome partitioning
MIQSMTGYGKAVLQLPTKKVTIEIKSLNSKNLDLNVRVPSYYKEKELSVRKKIAKALVRGKVDFSIYIELTADETATSVNKGIVNNYINQLKNILTTSENSEIALLNMAIKMPDALKTEREELDEAEWQEIETAINGAIKEIIQYRTDEALSLEEDFRERIANIRKFLEEVKALDSERISHVKTRLKKAIDELEVEADTNRFEQELIYYLEKLDINEEKVRLENHLNYFLETIATPDSNGKGGVGKSTITANTAVTLAKMGFNVGVLDADIYGPSQHLMFDVEKARPLSVNVDGRSKMKPVENYGVKLLSLGFFTNPDQAVIWRGPMASKALKQLIFDADWGELDFLLLDLPPGTGDVHLSIVQSLPINGAVVVSTPQNIALADAKKGVAMFQQDSIKVPVLGIVENMAYFTPEELPNNKYYIFGKDGAKHLAEDIKTKFLGEIPLVQSIREAGDVGHPVALQENTVLEEAFANITKEMVGELIKRNENLPPTEIVRITTMSGCSAVKKK